jgi:phage repressor protein C with HTH and peptisase S24 domain
MTKEEKALKIKIMLKEKGITQRALAQKIGESHNQISNRLNGDRPISAEFLMKLRPILGDEVMELIESPGESPPSEETRPRVDLYAAGGGNEVLDGVTLAQCEQIPVVPLFPRYDFTMRITGESMLPYLHPGDEVACLQIKEPTFLQWGRIHVLSTSQGVVIKKIFDADGAIRCVSFNPDYPDFIVPKQEIYSYNLVVGLIRL